MISVSPSSILTVGLVALIGWRMYSRMRRLIGRQKWAPKRSWVTACLFPVLVLLLALAARDQPNSELALLGGILIGTALGVIGLRHTKFESTPAGRYYTPNAHIGIALSLLLAGRILLG